jgi:hypothetical protein
MEIERIHVPKSHWALKHTDPKRHVQQEMFSRVYDRNVNALFDVDESEQWWTVDVGRNRDRVVIPEKGEEAISDDRIICVCHDIERGLGHVDSDPAYSVIADATAPGHLNNMLAIEREAGVKATYAVVGSMLPDVRGAIEADGHCLAFHSWDHKIGPGQLGPCRSVDYRLKGYRPPQSVLTTELNDENLLFHNFEWLATSAYSFGFAKPRIENRLAKLPIHFDDFAMYKDGMSYEAWEGEAIASIESRRFVAFGLHDCYGQFWLPYYADFLAKISTMGKLMTMNQVADRLFLENALP